jgi:hypothetical protein
MLILEKQHPPMRKLTQPWKLCRSFGIRPVGNFAGPRWTEAGITAQQIPSLPSRRTFRGKVDTHCRPADRVVGDHRDFDPRNPVRPQLRNCLNLQIQGRRFRLSRTARTPQAPASSNNHPIVSSGVTAQNYLVAVTPTFPLESARDPFVSVRANIPQNFEKKEPLETVAIRNFVAENATTPIADRHN